MVADAYSWCPECKKWVPVDLMNYDNGVRVCTPCLEGTSNQNSFVVDAHHEKTKCIFCGSWETTEQAPTWKTFKCQQCSKLFRRM